MENNKMKKTIITIILVMIFLPMVIAISPSPNGECYVHEPVLLRLEEGESVTSNYVSLITNYSDLAVRDINISLNDITKGGGQSTFLGASYIDKVDVNTLIFYNATNQLTYLNAISEGWIEQIEWVELDETRIPGKFNNIVTYEGYWVTANQQLNMTIPNVFGETSGNTINWSELRFSNGAEELNISEAGNAGWISSTLKYWGYWELFDVYTFRFIDESGSFGKTFVESYDGLIVNTFIDNLYLITDNSTEPCKIKPKCNAKFIGNNKVCKPDNVHAKYVGSQKVYKPKWFTNHWIRLLGALRDTIG